MKLPNDPSVLRNIEQRKERLKKEGGEGWKRNLTPDEIAEIEEEMSEMEEDT